MICPFRWWPLGTTAHSTHRSYKARLSVKTLTCLLL
jgi:hypothetical protein